MMPRDSVTSSESEPPQRETSLWRDADAPDCDICGGAGYVRLARPVGDPEFGQVRPCGCQQTQQAARTAQRLQRLSNLGPLSQVRLTVEEALTEPQASACRYADEAGAADGWLLLVGPPGSGRTRLAAELANRRIADSREALYFVAADLLDRLRSAVYATESSGLSYELLFEHVRDVPFLILDDLDYVSPTDWAREKLHQLLNHRRSSDLHTVLIAESPSLEPVGLQAMLTDRVTRLDLSLDTTAEASQRYRQFGGMTRDILQEYRFDNFREHGLGGEADVVNLPMVRQHVEEWTAQPSGWLVMVGETGVGKTHLAAAAAAQRLHAGDSVCFAVVPELLDALRASYSRGDVSFEALFAFVKNVDLLVLDDLGAQQTTDWANDKIYQLCGYRYTRALSTVITMNDLPDEFPPRLASRIMDTQRNLALRLNASDYRTGQPPRPFTQRPAPRYARRPARPME